jgi:hypothetical protein
MAEFSEDLLKSAKCASCGKWLLDGCCSACDDLLKQAFNGSCTSYDDDLPETLQPHVPEELLSPRDRAELSFDPDAAWRVLRVRYPF